MPGIWSHRQVSTLALATGLVVVISGCGGDDPKIEDASGGKDFRVSARASFDQQQDLARTRTLKITVRNEEEHRTLPDVAVVLKGLQRRIPEADNGAGRVADPRRPIWVLDEPPAGGQTAYVDTWALGKLGPGEEKTFRWRLTPTVAGTHKVTWRVAAALDENGPVQAFGGKDAGSFTVRVRDTPAATTIDPDTGRVVPAT